MTRAEAKEIAIAAAMKIESMTKVVVPGDPDYEFILRSTPVVGRKRKLKARWVDEQQQRLSMFEDT